MSETLRWWVMMQVVAIALLPLCLALFRRLPDRGYALSKPFALLFVGYLFWILNVLNVLPNTTGGIWAVIFIFLLASGYLFWQRRDELLAFVREHVWLIGVTEALFFLAFITAAYLRSYVPDISGTEQPMDFMFLNAMTRADSFPPQDPWLAGENVAYYYFGYLLISIMTRLSDVATSIGYNLGLAMIVALAATAAFSLVYNLAALRERPRAEAGPGTPAAGFSSRTLWRPMIFGLIAVFLVLVMGNLEGLFEWLAAHGVGGNGFWEWVGIRSSQGDLALTGYESGSWYPDQFWFWFRATRVLEVKEGLVGIHEFPFFSFVLGDLHPHVMSIPFILLAGGAALALLRSEGPLDLVFWLERPFWLAALAVILGALAFVNTWDMPTMAFVILLVALLRNRLLADRWSWGLALDTLGFVVPLLVAALLAYIPFYFGGFDSQASGFGIDTHAGTRPFHALLLWGPFAVLVLPYAVWRISKSGFRVTAPAILWSLAPAAVIVVVWLVWGGLEATLGWLPDVLQLNQAEAGLWSRVSERGWHWLTIPFLGGALGLLLLALAREVETAKETADEHLSHIFALAAATVAALLILGAEFFFIQDQFNSRMNTIFKLYYQAWLLLSIAGGFALYELARGWRLPAARVPERVRVDSSLGDWRTGELAVVAATLTGAVTGVWVTYDTTVLLVITGALIGGALLFSLGSVSVLLWRAQDAGSGDGALSWRAAWGGGIATILIAAFVYPVLAPFERTNDFDDRPRTLDGLAYLKRGSPDEWAAIQWLSERDGQPVVAEADGEGYRVETSRASGATGLLTILGWKGHESQWRGSDEPQKGRPEDLATLYTSTDADEVRSVVEKYGITYVFLGPAERAAYSQVAVPEMGDLFEQVYPEDPATQGEVAIYRVRSGIFSNVTVE